MESSIQFEKVNFSYRNQPILHEFDFQIPPNQLIGMVGVNGSGKSTLLKLILGLLSPKSGSISILGEEAGHFKTKKLVGSSLQDVDFPGSEKVAEILHFVCAQHENPGSVDELVEDFQLTEFTHKRCSQLSGGMKRRLALACAFAGNPQLVLLDEPTTGLDKESRKKLVGNLKKYQIKNKALVLMISHHPDEVMEFVHQFYHLKDQRIIPVSTDKMKQSMNLRRVSFISRSESELPPSLSISREGEKVTLVTDNSDDFVKKLVNSSHIFEDLRIHKLGVDELLGEFL